MKVVESRASSVDGQKHVSKPVSVVPTRKFLHSHLLPAAIHATAGVRTAANPAEL